MPGIQTIGALIKEKRTALAMSQRALARLVEVDHTTLCKIEKDQLPPSEDLILRLADTLEIDPDFALACAGRVAADVIEIIARSPELVKEIRATAA